MNTRNLPDKPEAVTGMQAMQRTLGIKTFGEMLAIMTEAAVWSGDAARVQALRGDACAKSPDTGRFYSGAWGQITSYLSLAKEEWEREIEAVTITGGEAVQRLGIDVVGAIYTSVHRPASHVVYRRIQHLIPLRLQSMWEVLGDDNHEGRANLFWGEICEHLDEVAPHGYGFAIRQTEEEFEAGFYPIAELAKKE